MKVSKNILKKFGMPILLTTITISSIPITNVKAETPEVNVVSTSEDRLEYILETNDGEVTVSAEKVDKIQLKAL
jgi:hypothetical protein